MTTDHWLLLIFDSITDFNVKIATITIVIKLQFCTAQLFPWSNIKHYFDQKTKHGPGSGGILNIAPDLDDPNNDKTSSGDRPYRNTDTDTYFISNKNNKDKNIFTEQFDTTTSKDITKQILKINKNKNKIHLNFDNAQNHRSNDEEIQKVNRYENNFTPELSINHDSTIKPLHKPIKEQNINIELLSNNKNILTEDNYESQTQNTIVITQKPIVVSPSNNYSNNKTQNYNKISHKTVSIIPSVNIKTLSFNDQPIYVTTRPQNFPTTPTHRIKIIESPSSSTHRPLRPTNLFRPRPQYYNIQNNNYNKNTPIFLPTVPPPTITTVLVPKIINSQPSQSPDVRYFNKNNEESYVEMVPSLGIEIKTSNINKPFRITDRGVVDYLVPPPPPSSLPQQSEPKLSIYGTKQYKRKPYSLIKDDAVEKNINNNNKGELKIYNDIPEKTEQQFNRNNKKAKHYLNSIKQQQRSQKEENDSSLTKEDTKNLQTEQRSRIKKPQQLTINQYKRNKYSNHKMSSSDRQTTNNNNENHHTAASDINEQITSETGFSGQPQTDGQRVEFQMHGQNGPKSYKFGFDTGKGHNRQFRYEERDKDGHVKGHYGYYDKEGKLQVVNYEADPHTGFKAEPA